MEKNKKYLRDFWEVVSLVGAKGYLDWLPDAPFLRLMFYAKFKRRLNLENPKAYNEKIQWLKLYDRNPLYTTLVDKYKVREYVKQKIGDRYLIPLLGCWSNPDDIDFESLPDRYVLKCNHDSGTVIICTDTRTPGTCGVGDGHSWVVFYNTDTQTKTTVGTWGNLDPEGLYVNLEVGFVPEICRGRILSDERKNDVAGVLRKYRDLGEDAWSYTEPCSDFAIAIWKAATGEDLSTGLIFDTPTDLKNTILEMNGGKQCPCIKYLE